MQGGSCASAICKCHHYNIFPIEYRTKEITSAPPGLITVRRVTAEQSEYRSATSEGQDSERCVYFGQFFYKKQSAMCRSSAFSQ